MEKRKKWRGGEEKGGGKERRRKGEKDRGGGEGEWRRGEERREERIIDHLNRRT